jgi:hypothetical protein
VHGQPYHGWPYFEQVETEQSPTAFTRTKIPHVFKFGYFVTIVAMD